MVARPVCKRAIRLPPAFQRLTRLLGRQGFWDAGSDGESLRLSSARGAPENAAFITIHDRGYNGLEPKLIFFRVDFSSSPAVSALEHPVYDLTLLACVDD